MFFEIGDSNTYSQKNNENFIKKRLSSGKLNPNYFQAIRKEHVRSNLHIRRQLFVTIPVRLQNKS